MLRRWVPAGLLLTTVVATSPTIMAQTAPTKTGTPTTTAKPAPAGTTAKPATASTATSAPKPAAPAKPGDAKAPAPAEAKAGATTDPKPADASAATTAPSSDPDKEATRLLDDGKKAYKAGQFDKAREAFAASYKVKPDHNALFWLAHAEAKSSRPRDAAEHLELYLREAKAAPADDRQTAQKLFEEVTAKLATWNIKVSVDGAEVYLNGKLVGKSPLAAPLFVEPNTHEVEARKEGFANEKDMLVAAPNTESETTLVMKPAPIVEKPKDPKPPEKKIVEPPPPPSPKWRTYGIIGGGALTAVGLGLGIGLTVSASGKSEEADAQLDTIKRTTPSTYGLCGANQFQPNQAPCAKLSETLSSQDARANGALAGFIIAGVGAVGTVGLIVLPKLPIGRKLMVGMKIAPVISLDRVGGTVTGSF